MKIKPAPSEERILADQKAASEARLKLIEAHDIYSETGDAKKAMAVLTKNQVKKLKAHANLIEMTVAEVLQGCGDSTVRANIAAVIFASSGRQSDGEKRFQGRLEELAKLQSLFFHSEMFPMKLPPTFLAHAPWWKGMDFMSGYANVIELTTHKYNNGNGGAQTYGCDELLRLVKISTHGPLGPGGLIEHQAEAFERFFFDGLASYGYKGFDKAILACIQDGSGRDSDILKLQTYAAASVTNRQNILVFAGNHAQYALCRPLLLLNLLGWEHFSQQQQDELMNFIAAFAKTYPEGLNGMRYRDGDHRNLLLEEGN